jgi:hypothetical protein
MILVIWVIVYGVFLVSVRGGAVVLGVVLAAAGYTFRVSPDPGGAPGAAGIQHAIDVFAVYALLAAAAGFLLGAAVWAVGGRVGNDYTATGGKMGMAVSVGVAFLVGAAATILNFAYGLG